MSGPVTPADAPPVRAHGEAARRTLDLFESRTSEVGAFTVRRALPRRQHRTIGAWCFADHMGPASVTSEHGIDIGPHPHMGLQTVTWLLAGEVLHRDSLGSEQVIHAGELNLMTAGHGVAHSEEATGRYAGAVHGIQLWVAQPALTRDGPPAFEHHAELPRVELDQSGASAVVFVGALGGATAPARRDTDHVGAELTLSPRAPRATVPLREHHEHALVVLSGAVDVDGTVVEPGRLAYLGTDRDELAVAAAGDVDARVILLGGVPFDDEILMWWNFIARTRDEVDDAYASWTADDGRFGHVASPLARIDAPRPAWMAN